MTTSTPNTRVKDLNLLADWVQEYLSGLPNGDEIAAQLPSDVEEQFIGLASAQALNQVIQEDAEFLVDSHMFSLAASLKAMVIVLSKSIGVEDTEILAPWQHVIFQTIFEFIYVTYSEEGEEVEQEQWDQIGLALEILGNTTVRDFFPGQDINTNYTITKN